MTFFHRVVSIKMPPLRDRLRFVVPDNRPLNYRQSKDQPVCTINNSYFVPQTQKNIDIYEVYQSFKTIL